MHNMRALGVSLIFVRVCPKICNNLLLTYTRETKQLKAPIDASHEPAQKKPDPCKLMNKFSSSWQLPPCLCFSAASSGANKAPTAETVCLFCAELSLPSDSGRATFHSIRTLLAEWPLDFT